MHLIWTEARRQAYDKLLECLTSSPMLRKFDPVLETFGAVDASEHSQAIGSVLSQRGDDGMRPVACLSRKMTNTEMRYGIRD